MGDIIKILGESGDGSTVTRYLPADERSFYPFWQAGKPWLEQENNLFVATMREAIRQFIKGLVGSGFLQAGDYVFPGAADNIFHMEESRVAVDGIPIHIGDPDNTQLNIITLPAPPGVGTHDDLAWLEVWIAEVARDSATFGDDNIYKQGGVDNAAYTNDIQDPTMLGEGFTETTRRVQIRWRIRTESDIDFGTYPEGIDDPSVLAQGEQGVPVATYVFTLIEDEIAGSLYRAGDGDVTSFEDLGSLDGYVYGIPIAQVARGTSDTTIAIGDVTDLRRIVSYAMQDSIDNLNLNGITSGNTMDINYLNMMMG